jgi:multisubunit Na+/H+ antiporter MnhF subunit
MLWIPYLVLSVTAALFLYRLVRGPSIPDRIIALDGLLVAIMATILIAAADRGTTVALVAVLLIALVGFVATAALARYVEQRGA